MFTNHQRKSLNELTKRSQKVCRGRNFNEVSIVPSKFQFPLSEKSWIPSHRSPLQCATYYLKQLEELCPRFKLFRTRLTAVSFLQQQNSPEGSAKNLSCCGNKSVCKINGSNTPGAPPPLGISSSAKVTRRTKSRKLHGTYQSCNSRFITPQ